MPYLPQNPDTLSDSHNSYLDEDVQIIPLYPEVQIIPIRQAEPQFPSESVPVLIIELGRTTNANLKLPQGAEWIVEKAIAKSDEPESESEREADSLAV